MKRGGNLTEEEYQDLERRRLERRQRREGTITAALPATTKACKPGWFCIPGEPIGKPRQTRSDKWKERPAVMKYRAWADKARENAPPLPGQPDRLDLIAFFTIPASYSKRRREGLRGMPHRVKPDVDNVVKAVMDALVEKDQCVHELRAKKRWDDGNGPRIELALY